MKIKQLRIGKFGKLKNVDISLDERITVIKGENEAGKSTVSGFIRYMLYGFASRSTSLSDNSKKRFLPWDDNECSGEMDFENSDGKSYTALRKTASRNSSGLIENATGASLDVENPGEYFLGVSDNCFKKTAFVGQNDIVFSDEGELENAIHNIVYSADESADTSAVLKKLDDARKYFLTKNGKGGKVYAIEQELEALREEKIKWQSGHRELLAAEHSLSETRKTLETRKNEFEDCKALVENRNALEAKNKLSEIEEARNKAVLSKEAFLAKQKSMTYDSFLPDESFREELLRALTDLRVARDAVQKASQDEKNTSENLENAYSDDRHKKVAEVVSQSNKSANEYAEELANLRKKKKNSLVTAIVLTLLVVTLPVAVFFYVKTVRMSKKIKTMLTLFGETKAEELYSLLMAHAVFEGSVKTAKNMYIASKQSLEKALEEKKNAENNLCLMLNKAGCENVTDDGIYERAGEFIKSLSADLAQLGSLKSECNDDFVRYNTLVSGVDLEKLSEMASKYDESLEIPDDKTLKQRHMYLTQSIQMLSDKERELEKKAAVLSGTLPKPAEIESRISSLEYSKKSMLEKHDALVMAIEALEKASQNIKNTASPYITSRSGELFSQATDGKYKALFSDKAMQLSFLEKDDAEVRDAGYLSTGTRTLSYLCLRIALCEYLYKEKPVLVFDDAFAFVDNERLEIFMSLLWELSENFQIVILSCHDREANLLSDKAKIIDFKI